MKNISVCLLSGGLDSCVAAALAKQTGDEVYFLTLDWGQKQVKELKNAKKTSEILKPKEHKFVDFSDFSKLSHSALTSYKEIPRDRTLKKNISEIPVTYPPGRDPTFIFLAASWLESIILEKLSKGEKISSGKIVIGTNKEDSLVYPDCQSEVYTLMNKTFAISTKAGNEYKIPFTVHTPLIGLTKKEVLAKGIQIKAPVEYTRSCYTEGDKLCGECDPCRIIYFAFQKLGVENPFEYEKIPEKKY